MEKLHMLLQLVGEEDLTVGKPENKQTVRSQLEAYINELIQHDFPKLVDVLYRVDVSEKRLKELLATDNNTNSATLITDLLIERQLQKQASRQANKPNTNISEEDSW